MSEQAPELIYCPVCNGSEFRVVKEVRGSTFRIVLKCEKCHEDGDFADINDHLYEQAARCERLEKALAVAAITLATVFKKDFEPYMGRMKPLLDKTKDLKIERVEDYVTSALSHPDVSQEKGEEPR